MLHIKLLNTYIFKGTINTGYRAIFIAGEREAQRWIYVCQCCNSHAAFKGYSFCLLLLINKQAKKSK